MFEGHNGYVAASYALFFLANAAIIGSVLWQRQRTKARLETLHVMLDKDGANRDRP